jgi:hypothetical protein
MAMASHYAPPIIFFRFPFAWAYFQLQEWR